MTYAPDDLLAVRRYLQGQTGLPADALGIPGDADHASTGGYHEGNDDLNRVGRLTSDYSKRESARDRPGTNAASALDIGQWTGTRGAAGVSWLGFSRALVDACGRGDPCTADIREVIYTPDGSTVRRFDRLGIRATGDSSHLIHTHISFFRDSEGRRARTDNILGLLVEIFEGTEADVDFNQNAKLDAVFNLYPEVTLDTDATADGKGSSGRFPVPLTVWTKRIETTLNTLVTTVAALAAAGGTVESGAIIAHMNELAAAETERDRAHQRQIADLRAQLAAAQRAAAAQLDAPPAG